MDKVFDQAFADLNEEQKKAVETIQGPLFVIAGPGTGKTEMLALRAANILRKDDTMLPSNVLCLTFTENAADNMRRRLIKYIGQDAYQVAIHTFNSFGQYVMNAYPEFFYEWREMETADELTTHRLLEEILESLPGDRPLAARGSDGTFYAIRQLKNFISDAKNNNLTPDELRAIIKQNRQTYEKLTPVLQQLWPMSMSASGAFEAVQEFISKAAIKRIKPTIEEVEAEQNMIVDSLARAADEAEALTSHRTKPFTAWKDIWLAKDENGSWVFKAADSIEKLESAADLYEKYQRALESRGLVDFNDQIVWVLRTMKSKSELRYNLQERFQYIMIDEFQDTNRAQLLLAQYITDSPVHEAKPNIMVVGDDDQAIFRFQGADIGNVEVFESKYDPSDPVTLVKNYRSTQEILDAAKPIRQQIGLSLEKSKRITKELVATVEHSGTGVSLNEFTSRDEHYAWVAHQIKKLLDKGTRGKEIAVLARERQQLDDLVPYLRALKIPIEYERSENVLEQEQVLLLLRMAKVVSLIGEQRLDEANTILPQILSEPMWQIDTSEIWQVAARAYKEKKFWLDVIMDQNGTRIRQVADFLIHLGNQSRELPAEKVLDALVGISKEKKSFVSPFKEYFFAEELLGENPADYLTLLSHLSTLRRHLRKYQSNSKSVLTTKDLVGFAESYMRAGTLRMIDISPHRENDNSVQLMTVHKAKGLEFDNVFVIGLQNSTWTKTGRSNRFSYPKNLQIIKPADNDEDDSLRLLFVAMTRPRHCLEMCYYLKNEDGKPEQPFAPLLALQIGLRQPKVRPSSLELSQQYEQRWLKKHGSIRPADMRTYLKPRLDRYKLSSSHLNDFLDISQGGPLYFLTQHLLLFPSTKPTYAIYGSAMHAAISEAHEQIAQAKKLDIDKVINKFHVTLSGQPLDSRDLQQFTKDGPEQLRFYLEREAGSFNSSQKVDVSFADQAVTVGQAQLKGNVDRMDFDEDAKEIIISDYKTGTPEYRWELPPSAKEYERIKMHRYRNQLMFYKLLVDGSNDWGRKGWRAKRGILRFLKKNQYSKLSTVKLDYNEAEMAQFTKLLLAVWNKIQKFDFPNTTKYPQTAEGIIQFEQDLISGKI